MGIAVVAGCSMVRAVDNSKNMVGGDGFAVKTESGGTAVVDLKVAGSKIAQTH